MRDWFRAYASPEEVFTAHGQPLRDNSRYAAAFDHLDDPYAFAQEIANAGYATDRGYFNAVSKRMRDIEASL